jgi:hypothetical protein
MKSTTVTEFTKFLVSNNLIESVALFVPGAGTVNPDAGVRDIDVTVGEGRTVNLRPVTLMGQIVVTMFEVGQ